MMQDFAGQHGLACLPKVTEKQPKQLIPELGPFPVKALISKSPAPMSTLHDSCNVSCTSGLPFPWNRSSAIRLTQPVAVDMRQHGFLQRSASYATHPCYEGRTVVLKFPAVHGSTTTRITKKEDTIARNHHPVTNTSAELIGICLNTSSPNKEDFFLLCFHYWISI